MSRILLIMLISAASVSARASDLKYPPTNILTATDSLPRITENKERWSPVSVSDAQAMARQQGDSWKNILKQKQLLIGLGINGPDKLKTLASSSDAMAKTLYAQIISTADNDLSKPLPDFFDPAFAVSNKGQTATSAGQQLWLRPWGDQAVMMSVACRTSNNPAYRQRLHDLVLRLCKFPTWGTTPLNADIATAHVARGIAMAWNWCPDLWSADERKLIIDSVRSKVNTLSGAIYGNNKVWWAGSYTTNINNVSAAGSGICGVAFLNDIPEASEWLAAAWLNFKQVANYAYTDGSSAEGTSYWAYGMSFILQFIEASDGLVPSHSLYDLPFLKNAVEFRVNSATPGFNEIISWGDSDPHDYSGPKHYLLRFASEYKNPQARFLVNHIDGGFGGGDDVKAWAWLWSQPLVDEQAPTETDYFANVSDIINSRSGWQDDDYVFSFKSGFTNRSHSHLDAGSVALNVGGDWLLPTPRYGKGRVNGDFWDRSKGGRWRYQSNSTEANSTLVINKSSQRSDLSARGTIDRYASYDDAMLAECDLSQAYDGVNTARRRAFHKRGEYIILQDAVTLKQPGQVEWLLQSPPNGVVNNNSVNIQGKHGSATVTLLSPQTPLATRQPSSERQDVAEVRNTLSAGISGSSANFIAVIEPKISGRDTPERNYSVTPDGALEIKTATSLEHLHFANDPSALSDATTAVNATARLLYVKTSSDKLSEIIVTDARKLSVGSIQLSAAGSFSAELLKVEGKGWKLSISSGKSITVKGGNITRTDGGGKLSDNGQLRSEGNYMLQ